MEVLEVVELLTGTGKFDGLAGNGPCGKCGTSAGVTVQLGEDDAVDADLIVERGCHVDGVLTGHGVDDQQDLVRVDGRLDVLQFLHELFVYVETTGGVDKDVVIPLVFRQADTVLCNFDRVALSGFVYRDTGVLADHL